MTTLMKKIKVKAKANQAIHKFQKIANLKAIFRKLANILVKMKVT